MAFINLFIMTLLTCFIIFASSPSFGRKFVYDPNCDCYVPDHTTPDIQDPVEDPPPVSPFDLKGTGIDPSTSKRDLSDLVSVVHSQPDGVTESRVFRYSTPKNFANRADKSINLWFVFHGRGGTSQTMHEFFEEIPHTAPTLLVYPQSLQVDHDNVADPSGDSEAKWRLVRKPGHASDPNAFRDVVFVDWLATKLLKHNSQLKRKKVFSAGFSSGAGLSWMLLCYRSATFQGFAMYSQQLGSPRESEGCGEGQLAQTGDTQTGYEKLTGQQPDKYGYKASGALGSSAQRASTKAVFYAHGTVDDNLRYDGSPGCWERGECELPQDPQYSMDPSGPLEGRDDISTVNWLTRRHQLPSQATTRFGVLDGNPDAGDDDVTTRRYDYKYVSDPGATFVPVHGEPIRWYEMNGAGHSLSALDRSGGQQMSKDYDVSIHTQQFFEAEAGMLKKK